MSWQRYVAILLLAVQGLAGLTASYASPGFTVPVGVLLACAVANFIAGVVLNNLDKWNWKLDALHVQILGFMAIQGGAGLVLAFNVPGFHLDPTWAYGLTAANVIAGLVLNQLESVTGNN